MALAVRGLGATAKVSSGNPAPAIFASNLNDIHLLFTSQQDNEPCSVLPGTGGAVVRAVGAKTAALAAAATPSAPVGIATGDLELMIASTIAGGSITITSDGGGAWTAIGNQDVTGGERVYAWYRVRAGGDGSPQVTPASDHICACRVAVYVNSFDSTTPIEVFESSSETTSDTSFSYATANSTSKANCLAMVVCSSGVDSNTGQAGTDTANANLDNITLHAEHETANGLGGGYWFASGLRYTAGAIGTWTQTMVSASPKAYLSFAIRPNTTGWTRKDFKNDGVNRRGSVWWIRDDGALANPTVVHASATITNAIIVAVSGVDSGLADPFRDIQNQTGTSTTTVTAPALTGVVSGDLLLFYGLFTVNDTSGATTNNWGTVSGFTEDKDDCSSLGGAWAVSFGIDDLVATGSAGSVTSSVGWTGAFGATFGWIGWQMALSSASSASATSLPMDLFDRRTPRRRSMQRI